MAFEEIKAKLGLDITEFEKGMLNANRAAEQTAVAQRKLADFRRNRTLQEANDTQKIVILEKELADLYAIQATAAAGTAPHLKAQLEIEKKLVEIGKVRQAQKAAEQAMNQQMVAQQATKPAAAAGGSLADIRKNVLQTAGAFGATDLLRGFGVGALVAALRSATTNAQNLRKEARELGKDLEPSVAAAARLGDALSVFGGAALVGLNKVIQVFVDGVDGFVASVSALAGIGSISENLEVLSSDPEAQAAAIARSAEERKKKSEQAAKAEEQFQSALADLEQARVDALTEQLGIEDQILFKQEQLNLAKQDALKTQADTVEAVQAEKDIVEIQAELARLLQQRDEEAADKKQAALDLQKKTEEEISAEKERQIAKEEKLAATREASAKKLAAAQQAAAQAGAAYAQALSDQSAATLGEVIAGTRGSAADRRAALRVQDLRAQAQRARDTGATSLLGGQAVAQADILSERANVIQAGISSLSTAERNPLGAVEEQLIKANEELATIRDSLQIMEVEY
jgi:hypothetical protein